MTTTQDIRYIPTLDPKPYKPRCNFGRGHCWIVVGGEDDELCQCSTCGCMSSNWGGWTDSRLRAAIEFGHAPACDECGVPVDVADLYRIGRDGHAFCGDACWNEAYK